MTLTITKLSKAVTRRLHYKSLPPELSIIDLANDAGWWFVGYRAWNFLNREPYSLDLTDGQEYIELPDDFSALISVNSTVNGGRKLRLTTLKRINDMREGDSGESADFYWGAISFPVAQIDVPPASPRLEIWGTPTETVLEAFKIVYRAGWKTVSADTDEIPLPSWCLAAYTEVVVAMAGSREQEEGGSFDERIARSMSLLEAAASIDGTIQEDYGAIEGGALEPYVGRASSGFGDFRDPGGP